LNLLCQQKELKMDAQEAELIWEREEACAAAMRDGDAEGMISFVHEQFQGWPSPASPFVNRDGLLDFVKNDIAAAGAYSFSMERTGIRVFGNFAINFLIYRANGKNRDGTEFEETARWTHTWIKEDSGWKILGGMSNDIEKPE
jgi:ketosteroid isomerase-like protein